MILISLFSSININNWTIKQWNSYQSYTFGSVSIPDDGYLILGRDATKTEFEDHWGHLPSNVVYVNSENSCPMINGGETFSLYNATTEQIDTTHHSLTGDNLSMQRDSTNTNTWHEVPDYEGTPGSGVNGGANVGVVITEATADNGNWHCEFIELYYDAGGANTPPEIMEIKRHPINPPEWSQVIVRSEAFDNQGIIADSLFWNINGGDFNKETSDSTSGIYFYYSISPALEGDSINYYISVWDEDFLFSVSDTQGYTVSDTNHFNVLFDLTKDETAVNADWIIDDDMPEPYPRIPWEQEDWVGAISDWGYALLRDGHFSVKTLPPDDSITYGMDRFLDLSNFDIFIICEPQNPFNLREKTTIFDFVKDGGGLFMVGNHLGSDRNGNMWDSPQIWNDLGSTDSFGIHFNVSGEYPNNLTDSSTNYSNLDTVINGYFGIVDDFYGYWAGTGITIYQSNNNTANGHIWLSTHPYGGNEGVMLATAKFGNGRVAGTGDSSPIDDGTGNPGNNLYNGWGAGSDSTIILNTTYWLCKAKSSGVEEDNENYIKEEINVDSRDNTIILRYIGDDSKIMKILIFDCLGRIVEQNRGSNSIEISSKYQGIYFLKVIGSNKILSYKLNLFGGCKWLLSK